jgi:hypothetical protein
MPNLVKVQGPYQTTHSSHLDKQSPDHPAPTPYSRCDPAAATARGTPHHSLTQRPCPCSSCRHPPHTTQGPRRSADAAPHARDPTAHSRARPRRPLPRPSVPHGRAAPSPAASILIGSDPGSCPLLVLQHVFAWWTDCWSDLLHLSQTRFVLSSSVLMFCVFRFQTSSVLVFYEYRLQVFCWWTHV